MKKGKWGVVALSIAMLFVGVFIGSMLSNSIIIGSKNLRGEIGELATSPSTPDRCIPESLSATCGSWVCGSKINNCNNIVNCGTCSVGQPCSNGNCIIIHTNVSFSTAAIQDLPSFVQTCAVVYGIINGEIPVDNETWEEFRDAPSSCSLMNPYPFLLNKTNTHCEPGGGGTPLLPPVQPLQPPEDPVYCPLFCMSGSNCDPPGPCNYCCSGPPPTNPPCLFSSVGSYCPPYPFLA